MTSTRTIPPNELGGYYGPGGAGYRDMEGRRN